VLGLAVACSAVGAAVFDLQEIEEWLQQGVCSVLFICFCGTVNPLPRSRRVLASFLYKVAESPNPAVGATIAVILVQRRSNFNLRTRMLSFHSSRLKSWRLHVVRHTSAQSIACSSSVRN
jgi:hypothetical protein